MSDDRRKNLRTQGKYSDGKVQKSRDKKQRSSLESKDSHETRSTKRNSEGSKSANNSFGDESTSSVKYKENSDYSFDQLQEVAKPTEIKGQGDVILSKTANGESRILYEPRFLHEDEANNYFDILYETINFDSRNIIIHGVEYPQPRLVAWFGPFPYSYSGVTLEAAEMPAPVLEIKEKVETYLKSKDITVSFNSVLINLYRNGKDSVAWHSDDEIMLGISPTIASISLGETRKFEIRPKMEMKNYEDKSPPNSTGQYLIHLTHGSLVVMTGCMQEDWQHRVPKEYHDKDPRINLTFRKVYPLKDIPGPVKGSNLGTAKRSCGRDNSSTSSKHGYKLDDEHFPSLQKEITPPKSNITSDKNDDADEEIWDYEMPNNKHDVENSVIYKNSCSSYSRRDEDLKAKTNPKNFNNENHPEKWHNIEPNRDNEKNSVDDKTAKKKLWSEDYDSSVNDFQENGSVEEKSCIKGSKSVNSTSINETDRNSFYEKKDLRKNYNKETSLNMKSSEQNVLNREESPLNSHNIKTDSYPNTIQESDKHSDNLLYSGHEVQNNTWTSPPEESITKLSLNVNAKAYPNSYISVTQESDLSYRQPPSVCHYAESNPWVNCPAANFDIKPSVKMVLNVDAKEFIPNNIISNEINHFSELQLEDLINCDINSLYGKDLQDHARYLKSQIRSRFPEISRFERKELEFLLEITDGTQNDKNQKLITEQICRIVQNNLLERSHRLPPNAGPSFDRSPRQRGYDNQNYYPDKGKRYPPNQSRNQKFSRGRY